MCAADFDALFPVCREVTQKYADTRSLAVRGWDCVLRLFSPLIDGLCAGRGKWNFPKEICTIPRCKPPLRAVQ